MSQSKQAGGMTYPMTNALYPNRALSLAEQPPVVLLAMCLFGEARGESREARRAVAQVVVNRARHAHPAFGSQRGLPFPENVVRVITRPYQFSCMLRADVNHAKIFDPHGHERPGIWEDCLGIAQQSFTESAANDTLTQNSDHYFDDSIAPPSWADPAKETMKLGRLRFFRLYLPALPSGAGHDAGAPPSLSSSSSVAVLATAGALPTSFPATPPAHFRQSRHGTMRWLGGRELSSLEAGGTQGSA